LCCTSEEGQEEARMEMKDLEREQKQENARKGRVAPN